MQRKLKTILFFSLIVLFGNAYCDEAPPSSEAISSCADKGDGDACDFHNKNGENIDGFCKILSSNAEGKLICIPSH